MSSVFLPPLFLYLAKMTVIMAILYGYYWQFLRNASFHPYNRWYLLGSILLSFILPLLRIPLPAGWAGTEAYSGFFQAAGRDGGGSGGAVGGGALRPGGAGAVGGVFGWLHGWSGIFLLYGLVAVFFILGLLRSLYYLFRLSRKYSAIRVEGVRVYQTEEPGSPFSFLNRLFWNRDLPLDTAQGHYIFRHEWYHIRQRHTLDILLLELARSLCWCNPFFHLVLRELKVIHEFLADRWALSGNGVAGGLAGDGDGESTAGPDRPDKYLYAEWLVWQSVGVGRRQAAALGEDRQPGIVHSFFHTHLKRRITMITQSNQGRSGYTSRVMALPLFFLLCCAFAAKAPAASGAGSGADSGHLPMPGLVRHYLHALRYPDAALKQGQEETIWFSVILGDHNQLKGFSQYDAAPDLTGRTAYTITVKSLPARLPGSDGKAPVFTDQNKKEVFLEEARKASTKIAADTGHVYPPGEYFFTIIFKLEKPAGSDSLLEVKIESPSK